MHREALRAWIKAAGWSSTTADPSVDSLQIGT